MPDTSFPFRPWVLSTCRTALFWGIGVLGILGGVTWLYRQPGTVPIGRAFGVLVFYGVLFLLSLLKIWWTAAHKPAVTLSETALSYQLLQWFRPRSIPLDGVLWCGMRKETQSLRFVWRNALGREREFFLNLAVIDRRNEFLHLLGRRLEELGLDKKPGEPPLWSKPGFEDSWVGSASS